MKKIQLQEPTDITRQSGIDFFELIRDGRAMELEPVKVAALFRMHNEAINALIEEVAIMQAELEKLKNRVKVKRTKKTTKGVN